jgi:hypothetical protein
MTTAQEEARNMLFAKYDTSFLNKKQTAKELGRISPTSLDRLRQTGEISSRKILGQIRFSINEVARYIADA